MSENFYSIPTRTQFRMTEVTSEFTVDEVVERQGDIWLEDRDPDRAGLLVAVEIDVDYDDDLWETIAKLNEGDVIQATLESQNEMNTVWHFEDIEVKRRTRQPAPRHPLTGARRRDRSRSP